MTYKTIYWDAVAKEQRERDCTFEEIAEIESRKASPDVVNGPILSTISALEASVSPRRLREAVTTDAGKTWMAAIDTQIANLRKGLVK
jgi:hypothetical protein